MCRVLILLHALHDVPVSAVIPPDNYRPSNSRQSYISTRTKASQRLVIQIKMFQQVINLPIDSNVARRVMYKDPKKSDKKKFDRKSIVRSNKATMNENKMNDDDYDEENNNQEDDEQADYSPNTETPLPDESVRNVEQDEQLEEIIQSDYDENKMNEENDDENEQKQKDEEQQEEEDLVIIPLNYMRVFYFLITNTKMTGQVQSGSGLGKVIEDETGQYMTISLRYEGSDFPLSTAKLPLSQFKCDYVSTVDDFMPLTIGGDTAELQMTIGLERAKDNLDMTHMKDRLYQFNDNIFVPPENYFSCDPVPEDWLAKLPHAGLTALDKKCSMGIWKDTNLEVTPMLEQEKSITNDHESPQESAFAARTIKPVDYNDENNDPVTRQYQTPSPTSQKQQQQQSLPPPLLGVQQPVKVNGSIQPLKIQSLKSESTPTIKLSARTYLTSPHDASGPTLSKREVMEFDDQKQGEQKETDLRKLTVKHSQNLLSQAVNIPPPLSTALKIRTPTGGSNKNSPVNALRIEQDIIPRTPRIEEMKKEQTEKAIRRESWPNSVWCMTVEFHTIFNVAHPVPGSKPYYPPPKKIDNRRYMRLDGGEDFEDVGVRRRSSITGITPDCKIACQARYYICGVPFTVDGFIVDPESNEATFQTTFKHYIKGSIESIGSFFKQTKAFVVEIYSPTLPQAGIYSTEVDWSSLAESILIIIIIIYIFLNRSLFRWNL